jgi:hypothetical protein
MAIAELVSGSETVGTTEWSLSTDTSYTTGDAQTTDGIFQVFLDLSALANGDTFRFRTYEKVLAGSTQRLVYEALFTNVQAEPVFASPSLILIHGWDMSLTKIAGTDRNIDWSIRQVA